MENAAEQAQQAQGWTAWRPSIWVRARYWTINMQTFEAGSAVLGQKEGKKENFTCRQEKQTRIVST